VFMILKRLSWFFREEWARYATAVSLLLVANVLEIIPPILLGYSIEGISQGTLSGGKLAEVLVLWAGITIVGYAVMYGWFYKLFGGSFVLERLLRSQIMRHWLKMTPGFFERNRTGDLMARATNDLRAVSATAGFGILTLIDSTLFLMTIIVAMVWMISWKLTLAALLPLPIIALSMGWFGRRIHEKFMRAQDAFGEMNDQVLEAIAGVRVIRAFVKERASQSKFAEMTNDVFRKNIGVARVDSFIEPIVKILVGMSYLIGLGYGGYLVFRSEITLGELVTFNVFLGMLIWPMFAIGELMNIMQRGNASMDRVSETLHAKQEVMDEEHPATLAKPGRIEFSRVTFRYPSTSHPQLSEISFRLEPGQTLGIVGRTGSGKTTLLKQLLREYPLGQGEIMLSGVPLQKIAMDPVRGWIGYVPQQPILFSRSIRENVRFGRSEASDAEVERALELASFLKDVAYLPQGLDTLVGEKGVALSGGQKQRVSIARALMIDPDILLLDDALSAVDAKTEKEIIRHIRTERTGKTTLIATHRLSAVQHADWILVLDEGRVVEEGTHEQLIDRGGWYKEQSIRQLWET
jgi:ATP-binding cassette subfamily B multidrug efflux pump